MRAKFLYTGIRVKDLDASVKFYTTVLGMKVRGRSRLEGTKGTAVDLVSEDGGHPLELNQYDEDSPYFAEYDAGQELDHLAFVVDDLDAALAEAAGAGYPTVLKILESGSPYAYIRDPNGIWIELAKSGGYYSPVHS